MPLIKWLCQFRIAPRRVENLFDLVAEKIRNRFPLRRTKHSVPYDNNLLAVELHCIDWFPESLLFLPNSLGSSVARESAHDVWLRMRHMNFIACCETPATLLEF
jgi:hypothetical protein